MEEDVEDIGPDTLERVLRDLGDCQRCPLCEGRKNIVFGSGDPHADLLILGEAPGEHEDLEGVPFVGKAGEMLDRMLSRVLKLRRDQVYVVNVVKCRPPRNRDPHPEEREACSTFLRRQIFCVSPKMILVLGGVAYRALFGASEGIGRVRGQWKVWNNLPVMATYHPSFICRASGNQELEIKKIVQQDLLEVLQRLTP
jgi:DNA polymerase